jgi:hypothetical protein
MRDAILTAVICGGAVLCVPHLWTTLADLADNRVLSLRVDNDVLRVVLVPAGAYAASTLALWSFGVRRFWLAPLLVAGTVLLASVLLERLIYLASTKVGLAGLPALVLVATVAGGWWAWAVMPGRPWKLRVAGIAVLGVLAMIERAFAGPLDVAVKRREIIATGLRPLLVDDPSWRLDYVYVAPDGRSISVGYENPVADNSLSVDLLSTDQAAVPAGGVRTGLRRLGGTASPRYLTRVEDQWVRMEFDHGEAQEAEVKRLADGLRLVDPWELAQRDAGLR